MTGVEILMVVAIVLQTVAAVVAMLLVNQTKYSALWICCIIGLTMLTLERLFQLMVFDGYYISDLVFAWVGIIVSLSFSIGVLCARFLVHHVDRITLERRLLENRLMTAVLRTEERSRAEVSRELHDGLGPLLSSAKMSLSALARAELSENERRTLTNTSAVIDEAIRSLREISNNLTPHVLNNFGLARGIKNFVEKVGAMHPVQIEFDTMLRGERFDSNIEVILYRVVCELVNNSLKHAQCTIITVSLSLKNSRLVLEYSDNGRGFSPRDVEGCGMGLSNISSRISSLSGTFRLDSTPGRGMRAVASVAVDSTVSQAVKENTDRKKLGKYDKR